MTLHFTPAHKKLQWNWAWHSSTRWILFLLISLCDSGQCLNVFFTRWLLYYLSYIDSARTAVHNYSLITHTTTPYTLSNTSIDENQHGASISCLCCQSWGNPNLLESASGNQRGIPDCIGLCRRTGLTIFVTYRQGSSLDWDTLHALNQLFTLSWTYHMFDREAWELVTNNTIFIWPRCSK